MYTSIRLIQIEIRGISMPSQIILGKIINCEVGYIIYKSDIVIKHYPRPTQSVVHLQL